MTSLRRLHGHYVHSRRVRVLCDYLSELLPANARVLDVGCGDGWLARLVMDKRKDLDIRGIDVMVRAESRIPVTAYDGFQIPFGEKSFDTVMFVDVLHHTNDPMVLLSEAKRVAARTVVIKDHRLNGLLAGLTLRFMDWVGNAPHGVALPYNYWPHDKWHESFASLNMQVDLWRDDLNLYPGPANWLFGRSLHFISRLRL